MASNPMKLPVADRIRLVLDLWDSIAAQEESVPVTPAQKAELDRRLAAYEADKDAAQPAGDVIAELRSKL